MKKALIISLYSLMCFVLLFSLPGDMAGSSGVSAYPAPNNDPTPTNYTPTYKVFLPVTEKCPRIGPYIHGVGISNLGNPDDVCALEASWWFNWVPTTENMSDPSYVPMWSSQAVPSGIFPPDYGGYILLFNEPGGASEGSNCILADIAAGYYATSKTRYPNAKIVVGGLFSWDSLEDGTQSCTSNDNAWRKHFVQKLGELGVTPPTYWALHGYVYAAGAPNSDEKEEVFAGWIGNMNSAMTTNIMTWWNEKSTAPDLTNYAPKYWITEYSSQRTGDDGFNDFVAMMNWVDTEMKRQPQTYPLERAAVFNNRCTYDIVLRPWCNGFEPTNLLDWANGDYSVHIFTSRGNYFKSMVVGQTQSLMSQQEEQELQLNPYPRPGELELQTNPYPLPEE